MIVHAFVRRDRLVVCNFVLGGADSGRGGPRAALARLSAGPESLGKRCCLCAMGKVDRLIGAYIVQQYFTMPRHPERIIVSGYSLSALSVSVQVMCVQSYCVLEQRPQHVCQLPRLHVDFSDKLNRVSSVATSLNRVRVNRLHA